MTRICLLVEIDCNQPRDQPQDIKDAVLGALKLYMNPSRNPTVQLTAFEPADDPVPQEVVQAAKDLFPSKVYNVTTDNSRYKIVLNVDGTGNITRLGGSSPYVPPDVASKPWDGIAYYFANGRFEDAAAHFGWGKDTEVFVCDGHIRRTSPIREMERVS